MAGRGWVGEGCVCKGQHPAFTNTLTADSGSRASGCGPPHPVFTISPRHSPHVAHAASAAPHTPTSPAGEWAGEGPLGGRGPGGEVGDGLEAEADGGGEAGGGGEGEQAVQGREDAEGQGRGLAVLVEAAHRAADLRPEPSRLAGAPSGPAATPRCGPAAAATRG
jgi:hypothetical protein